MENGLRNRRIGLALGALLLMAMAAHHPSANIDILTHDRGDLAPHQVKAAFDLGLVAVSVLYTWTAEHSAS